MANIKISELPAASAASAAQEFETNDSGTSKKVTGSQLKSFVKSGLAVADITDLTATASELNTLDGITGIASQAQAEAGTDNTTLMTPLRVDQAMIAQAGISKVWQSVTRNVDTNYQNTTGYPLEVLVKFLTSGIATGYIDMGPTTGSYVEYIGQSTPSGYYNTVCFTVPVGWYYRWRRQSTALTVSLWSERSA